MQWLLLVACWLLALPLAAPSTLINVQLDPSRPTQLYRAPGGDGGPGAWIITASDRERRPAGAHSDPAVSSPAPVKRRPPAREPDWTHTNRVEEGAAAAKPAKLPSFVVTSRPFGFKGSSSAGQQRPPTPQPAAAQSYWTPGQSYSTSGQGHTTSSTSQSRPPVKSYVRPSYHRPTGGSSGSSRPPSDSFVFSSSPHHRPSSTSHRQPSDPPRPVSAARPRPGAVLPAAHPATGYRPSESTSRPGEPASRPHPQTGGAGAHPAGEAAQTADAAPLAEPPVSDGASVTHKTAPDAVSTVGGKKLPTFNLGCRQGRRCSFIINAPTHVPQPTYTPYNKQTVDSYLQRFQTLLKISNSKKESSETSTAASAPRDPVEAAASANVASVVAAPAATSGFRASPAAAAASNIYSDKHASAVPSPGQAYREDIWKAAAKSGSAAAVVGSDGSSAALVAQRYRPGTADLYRLMRSSPSRLRTVRPAEATAAGAYLRQQWNPVDSQWSHGHREAKNVQRFSASSADERVKVAGESQSPGRRYSRYTVERVDPKTKATYPTDWNSEKRAPSNVVPVTGTIFKAHLSSGPISFQPKSRAKQSRSEGSFKHSSAVNSNPNTASIITVDGIREVPNVTGRQFRRRLSDVQPYQQFGRSADRPQVAPQTGHYAAPPSAARSAWRWRRHTISPRVLHK